ncbi:MAG: class I SAM-dependent methyltransferase [Burkholderiaceae bacterium]
MDNKMQLQQVSRVCPLLEAEHPAKQLDYAPEPWILLECNESGFVYLQNPPEYSHLEEDFAWETTYLRESSSREKSEPTRYALSNAIKKFRRTVLKRDKVMRLATDFLGERAKKHSDSLNVLDVGCAQANLLGNLYQHLPMVVADRVVPFGIEISTHLAGLAQQKLSERGGTCEHASAIDGLTRFDANKFDLIVLSSFLEHEINPLPLLRLCWNTLKPGGFVIIKVPNYDSVNRHVRGSKWCGFRWPDHVNYFTPLSLTKMAQKSGLQIARMKLVDRQPLSDSMYCVLIKTVAA